MMNNITIVALILLACYCSKFSCTETSSPWKRIIPNNTTQMIKQKDCNNSVGAYFSSIDTYVGYTGMQLNTIVLWRNNTWRTIITNNGPPFRDWGQVAAKVDNYLYIYGGFTHARNRFVHGDLWKYGPITEAIFVNPATASWTRIYDVTSNQFGPPARWAANYQSLVVNNDKSIILFGGNIKSVGPNVTYNSRDTVWRYSINTGEWTIMHDINNGSRHINNFPLGSCCGGVVTNNNKLYLFGGIILKETVNLFYEMVYYNSTHYSFKRITNVANIPPARRYLKADISNNVAFFAFGGIKDDGIGSEIDFNAIQAIDLTTLNSATKPSFKALTKNTGGIPHFGYPVGRKAPHFFVKQAKNNDDNNNNLHYNKKEDTIANNHNLFTVESTNTNEDDKSFNVYVMNGCFYSFYGLTDAWSVTV